VEKVLGAGGMGLVVAAHHIQLDEKVALKFILPAALESPDAVARFTREARAAVKIKGEHVARVIDVGTLESGAPYMVMEYLEGENLAQWLAQQGPVSITQAVEFVLQACVAVADAHALGIVHRDLKPANLFCVRRSDGQSTIKVLDFGISKLTHGGGSDGPGISMTKTSTMMGSPLYMSPEQLRSSKAVDSRTDIWALGVVLFELISGRPPFVSDSLSDLVIKIATEPIPELHSLRPDVPDGLEAVIARCLEKNADQRFGHIGELALALSPFGSRRAAATVERISGIAQVAGFSASVPPLAGPAPAPPGARATQPPLGTLPPLAQTIPNALQAKSAILGAGLVSGTMALGAVAFALMSKAAPTQPSPASQNVASQTAASQTAAAPAPSSAAALGASGASPPPAPPPPGSPPPWNGPPPQAGAPYPYVSSYPGDPGAPNPPSRPPAPYAAPVASGSV
jgi:hypothetical protein